MSKLKFITLVCFMFLLQACGSSDSSSESESETAPTQEEEVSKYPDDTYCAEVTYYNPNTGTNKKYDFNVDVENNELVKIHFPNDGWLDDSHFSPEDLDKNGFCSLTSDKGYKYEVQITGAECDFTGSSSASILTYADCATSLGINAEEYAEALKELQKDPSAPATLSLCEIIAQYISKRKDLKIEHDAELAQMKGAQNSLNNEMNEGYIQSVLFSNLPMGICHQLIVKKHGKYYWLEVNSSEKCTTGTMKFNSSQKGWQNVSVKESPDDNNPNAYQMRVKGSSSSLSELDAEIKSYCNL